MKLLRHITATGEVLLATLVVRVRVEAVWLTPAVIVNSRKCLSSLSCAVLIKLTSTGDNMIFPMATVAAGVVVEIFRAQEGFGDTGMTGVVDMTARVGRVRIVAKFLVGTVERRRNGGMSRQGCENLSGSGMSGADWNSVEGVADEKFWVEPQVVRTFPSAGQSGIAAVVDVGTGQLRIGIVSVILAMTVEVDVDCRSSVSDSNDVVSGSSRCARAGLSV
jgi:hypothetical protein